MFLGANSSRPTGSFRQRPKTYKARKVGISDASRQRKQTKLLTDVDHYLTLREPCVASLRSDRHEIGMTDRHHRNAHTNCRSEGEVSFSPRPSGTQQTPLRALNDPEEHGSKPGSLERNEGTMRACQPRQKRSPLSLEINVFPCNSMSIWTSQRQRDWNQQANVSYFRRSFIIGCQRIARPGFAPVDHR